MRKDSMGERVPRLWTLVLAMVLAWVGTLSPPVVQSPGPRSADSGVLPGPEFVYPLALPVALAALPGADAEAPTGWGEGPSVARGPRLTLPRHALPSGTRTGEVQDTRSRVALLALIANPSTAPPRS
jgi:hypothetical protein